jgi:Na+-driven multidrug efflux pump
LFWATIIMLVGWLVGELLPYPCARLFTTDEELIEKAVRGIRINMLVFPLIGSQAVITNFFQSIGKAKISIFLSLSRQMIFLLPLLIMLPPVMGVDGVWAALPASDTVAFVVTWIIMFRYMRTFKLQHKELTNGR